MKQCGFKKRGNLYVREVGHLLHMVDVQYSRWNDAGQLSFTLNCGIFIPGVTSRFRNAREPKAPRPIDCCVSARAGMLRQPYMDVWWKILADDAPEKDGKIREEIISIITSSVLPFLDGLENERAVADFLSRRRDERDKYVEPRAEGLRLAYSAIVWSMLGVRDRCQKCIEQAVQESNDTPLESVITSFARRFSC